MTRAIHVLGPVSRNAGGLYEVVPGLVKALAAMPGLHISVLGVRDEYTEADRARWEPCPLTALPVSALAPRKLLYAPRMGRVISDHSPDLLHCHGIWTWHAWATAQWGRRSQRAYMVTLHGHVDKIDLARSRFVKFVARQMYVNRLLKGARCIHALCEAEAASARVFGLRRPLCLIPNGVDFEPAPASRPPWHGIVPPGAPVLFYIGRITPKKGLRNLVTGWSQARASCRAGREWHLVIAGWEQYGHEAELKRQVSELNASGSIHFLGPQFGDSKAAAFGNATAFVLPTTSEGLPTVVLEAWSSGLPVLTTPASNIPEGFAVGAAIRAEATASDMSRALVDLFSMSDAQRLEMGKRGRRLVDEKFRWPGLAEQMRQVYEWMLGGGTRPSCVRLD